MIVSLSTWKHGIEPNRISNEILVRGGTALDAVEQAARYCEADLTCMSVGRGGLPDDTGILTLDASIMDHEGNCGSVAFVRDYEHVASIARRVMEKTPHVMLVGEGAERFADREGFLKSELLTDKARALYEQWSANPNRLSVRLRRKEEGDHEYVFEEISATGAAIELRREDILKPVNESHDTIGILALDSFGHLAGACTTSGLAFKMHGRVGDSPIIGAGLYVDGEVAAAVATGTGELVMRACSAFHIVELIRQGMEPEAALTEAMNKIRRDRHLTEEMQIGLMVIRHDGVYAAAGLRTGFQLAVASGHTIGKNQLFDVDGISMTEAKD